MSYRIRYACFSIPGKIRANNEDNFYVNGACLDVVNTGTGGLAAGELESSLVPVFGVFDGMGGESAGEAAAYIAANTMACFERERTYRSQDADGNRDYLERMCLEMNRKVCSFSDKKHILSMGTTAVCLLFSDESICCANVGDSRAYHMNESGLTQITTDQVLHSVFSKNPPLLQYIGMREEELTLQPEVFAIPYRAGEGYLLCSDGVTDMLSDDELYKILVSKEEPESVLLDVMQAVLDAGARDNATAVWCRME